MIYAEQREVERLSDLGPLVNPKVNRDISPVVSFTFIMYKILRVFTCDVIYFHYVYNSASFYLWCHLTFINLHILRVLIGVP